MPTPMLLAKLYSVGRAYVREIQRRIEDQILEQWSGLRPGEHDVHPTVEFRTANQICLNRGLVLKAGVILNGRSDMRDHGVTLGPDAYLKERCILDAYGGYIDIAGPSGMGQNVLMHGGGGIEIGPYVIMGPNCNIVASNHVFKSSQYPIMLQGDRRRGIEVGSNVWLGAGVTVVDGVSIGNNVVVGAGVVVTESIPDNTLIRPVGPAKLEPLRYP